jgi:hypothetical protein
MAEEDYMSNRAGYSADFMEQLGKCRVCGGSESYPMLVDVLDYKNRAFCESQMICGNEFHGWRRRIAAALYRLIMGENPAQRHSTEI